VLDIFGWANGRDAVAPLPQDAPNKKAAWVGGL